MYLQVQSLQTASPLQIVFDAALPGLVGVLSAMLLAIRGTAVCLMLLLLLPGSPRLVHARTGEPVMGSLDLGNLPPCAAQTHHLRRHGLEREIQAATVCCQVWSMDCLAGVGPVLQLIASDLSSVWLVTGGSLQACMHSFCTCL